jgi:hypothetical protein
MAFKTLTSFEVLANPVAPGVMDVPYVQQGFFLQISNLGAASSLVSLEYAATPAFIKDKGAIKLFTDIIDESGVPQVYPAATFLAPPVGFKAQDIPAGATWLIGVQYLLLPPPPPIVNIPLTGATPQDSFLTRGVLRIEADAGSKLLLLATIRQVFYNYSPSNTLLNYAEGAYAVPLIGGPEHNF